jgi:hypothetical protein
MGKREDRYLPIVERTLAVLLGRSICRVPPQDRATHDLETSDGLSPSIAAEVKELIPSDYLKLQGAISKQRSYDSGILAMRWNVAIQGETLANRLQPMPNFPEPSQEVVAALSEFGHVATRAERENEWRANQTLEPRAQVTVKGLCKDIETHLAVLERNGVSHTWVRLQVEPSDLRVVNQALAAISYRTRGALCNSRRPRSDEKPGIDLCFASGERRTHHANVVADRAQLWLDSDSSKNLRSSLLNSGADEKHGVLWMESDAERRAAEEEGLAFCPTRSLVLQNEIDALWIVLPPLVLKYHDHWSVALLPLATPA